MKPLVVLLLTIITYVPGFRAQNLRPLPTLLHKQSQAAAASSSTEPVASPSFAIPLRADIIPPGALKLSDESVQRLAEVRSYPAYPKRAQAAGVAGKVQVQITVSERGYVIQAVPRSGDLLLRSASVKAAKRWFFKSGVLSGNKFVGLLTFEFVLPPSGAPYVQLPPKTD